LKQGKAVRAMVRNEDERAKALRDMGAEVLVGNLLDLDSMHRAQAPERSYANGIELRPAGFEKIDNTRDRYVGSRRWELRCLVIVRSGTDAANKLGSIRFNAAQHALEYMSAATHTPTPSMDACHSPRARKQALPTRFTACDYDFNSLSFLPTAPGPKLI
jgi:hypothetical protein